MAFVRERERQSRLWLPGLRAPTVLPVDDQRGAFKRVFAAQLSVLRAGAGIPSQIEMAKLLTERGAVTSEATYRRWENYESVHLPDAWQIQVLCELLDCEPADLIRPPKLNDREVHMARRASRAARRGVDQARGDD